MNDLMSKEKLHFLIQNHTFFFSKFMKKSTAILIMDIENPQLFLTFKNQQKYTNFQKNQKIGKMKNQFSIFPIF